MAGNCWISSKDRLTLAAATAHLSPETVAASRQRGQALDLHETVDSLLAYFDPTP